MFIRGESMAQKSATISLTFKEELTAALSGEKKARLPTVVLNKS